VRWIATVLVAICLLISSALVSRDRHSFVRSFGGVRSATSWSVTVFGELRCYTFSASPSDVRRAVKEELVSEGYRVDIEDESLIILKRGAGAGEQQAFFSQACDKPWQAPTTCAIWIDENPTWIERQIKLLRSKMGVPEKLPIIDLHPVADQVTCGLRPHSEAGKTVLDVVLKNMALTNLDFSLQQIQFNDYDQVEELPSSIALKPRERRVIRFTVSGRAGTQVEEQRVNYWFDASGVYGSTNDDVGKENTPKVELVGGPGSYRLMITNAPAEGRSPTDFEVRKIVVWDDLEPALYEDQVRILKGGARLQLPMSGMRGAFKKLRYLVECRPLGNTRWRELKLEPGY
jgi:hypothetical protein